VEVSRRQIDAGGSHRRLAPGSRMTISQHPAHDGAALITLSGIKTQALGSSRSGQGDHSQLVFDDSIDEARLDLQTTQANTVLTLGYARHQIDNQCSAALGLGTGLATGAYGSLRAGQGLLITADARAGGTHAGHLAHDAREAIQQLARVDVAAY